MKRKFITLGVIAVVLLVAVFALFATLVVAPDMGIGVVDGSATVTAKNTAMISAFAAPIVLPEMGIGVTSESAIMNSELTSELILAGENTALTKLSSASIWLVLGTILAVIACRRRLARLLDLATWLRMFGNNANGTETSGGQNKFIQPVAA